MYIWLLSNGLPIVTSSSFVRSLQVEYTVVSLGPYPLKMHISLDNFFNELTKLKGNCSPAIIMHFKSFRAGISFILFKNIWTIDGVVCNAVTLCFFINSFNEIGDVFSLSSAITSFTPLCNVTTESSSNKSKLIVVIESIVWFSGFFK